MMVLYWVSYECRGRIEVVDRIWPVEDRFFIKPSESVWLVPGTFS